MSKYLRRLLNLCICACLLGVGTIANSASTDEPVFEDPYTVVVIAEKGVIEQDKAGHYQIRMNRLDVMNIMTISDKPFKIRRFMSTEDMKKMIFKWSNNFKISPPKAVVVIDEQKQQVKLESIQYKGDQIIFTITKDDVPIKKMRGSNVNIIIDDVDETVRPPAPVAW